MTRMSAMPNKKKENELDPNTQLEKLPFAASAPKDRLPTSALRTNRSLIPPKPMTAFEKLFSQPMVAWVEIRLSLQMQITRNGRLKADIIRWNECTETLESNATILLQLKTRNAPISAG